MGGLFSTPKPPEPEPMPDPKAAADAARREQLMAAKKRQGRASTMLSGDSVSDRAYSRERLGTY